MPDSKIKRLIFPPEQPALGLQCRRRAGARGRLACCLRGRAGWAWWRARAADAGLWT